MELTMDGRVALITGGSLGIGRAIGTAYAKAGGKVALVARRQGPLDEAKEEIEAACGGSADIVAVSADIAAADGCTQAVAQVMETFGQVDVLVNNAGSSRRMPFLEATDEDWQADLDLKFFAAVRLARLVMPGMMERKWGRIINVLNTGAKAPPGGGAPTAVSRAAGMALMKVLAGEGAAHNVLVNGMLVGRIESDQWVKRAKDQGREIGEFYDEMGQIVPMKRVGTADEFAAMALFLAASNGGSYITGTAINVDGGMCPVV